MIKAVIFDVLNVIFTPIPGEAFNYQLTDEMKALLWQLDSHDLMIGYLTNTSGKRLDQLVEQKILPQFKIRISSVEACFPKPDPQVYAQLVEELEMVGIKPEETLFIDDKEQNLEPARRIGIKTILFRGDQELNDSLERLVVK
ncbi:MAG: HAD-IA family hydrolase [Candidatus Dojkabacteria bacterium]|nr:MAG: HAD-IA family hydrolase [Candidatus Dojkabacteria bacterium]